MKALLEILAAVAKWFFGDRQQAARDAAETERRRREANKAVKTRDEDKVNAILRKHLIYAVLPLCLLVSCKTAAPVPEYIPAEEKALAIEWQGRPGWFVPQVVYEAMIDKLVKGGL
jgi:hypothetical protein